MTEPFPDLSLSRWRDTRDTLHAYVQVLGTIRATLAPRAKHWSHASLRVTAAGPTTTPLLAGDRVVEVILDLRDHRVGVVTNREERTLALTGQSAAALGAAVLDACARLGLAPPIDRAAFTDTAARVYDAAAAARYWQALTLIDAALKRLKAEHPGESSPVQLWPHGFDLAVLLFTGRKIPGEDPANEEASDEQMNFGFSTGDDAIPEPYFYATAYPTPPGFISAALPDGARFHTAGWTGAVLPYEALRATAEPLTPLLHFLRSVRDHGFRRMR